MLVRKVEASDNGYDGSGGIQTTSLSIQVAVAGVNDAPVVMAPSPARAIPGEVEALPGFMVLDPDTNTDGRISEGMLEVGPFENVYILTQKIMLITKTKVPVPAR